MKAMKSAVTLSTMLMCVAAGGKPQTTTQSVTVQSLATDIDRATTPAERAIKVSIATVGSAFGPPTTRYKAGEQIPIAITMTNTSDDQVFACISSDIYQNVPKLTRDGRPVPFMKSQSYERLSAQQNHTCEKENLPEAILLKPHESKLVDWFVLSDNPETGEGEPWYDPLPPGKYELTIQRRLACCDGPMLVSNTTSFEVVP